MSNKIKTGGCLCGNIQYEFDSSKVISAHHCHCKDCQKSTGSGKATIVMIPEENISLNGNLKFYTVTGTDAFGCSGQATVMILIQTVCGDIFIPTIFSPNGDGNNDIQCVMGNCIATMKYSIYDRWGEKVFETETQSECWDGMSRNKELNSGTFAYKFNAMLIDGTVIEQSGNLTLVR